jgi:hypothetical protein
MRLLREDIEGLKEQIHVLRTNPLIALILRIGAWYARLRS